MMRRVVPFALLLLGPAGPARAAADGSTDVPAFVVYQGRGRKKIEFPPKVNELDSQGIGLLEKGSFEAAVSAFSASLELMPKNPRALANRGFAYLRLKETDKALADYEKAVAISPRLLPAAKDPMSHLYLLRGRRSVDAGRPKDASQDFIYAVRLQPKNAAAFSELAYLSQREGKYDECVSYAGKAVAADPKYADSYANRAACLYGLKKTEAAINDLTEAIRLQPEYPSYYASRAGILFNIGRKAGAVRDARTAVKLDPRLGEQLAPILRRD